MFSAFIRSNGINVYAVRVVCSKLGCSGWNRAVGERGSVVFVSRLKVDRQRNTRHFPTWNLAIDFEFSEVS